MRSAIARRFAEIAAQVGAAPATVTSRPEPWMSTADLAAFLRLTERRRPREAALDWAKRKRLAGVVVNRELRFARRDVEMALAHDAKVRGPKGWHHGSDFTRSDAA